MPRAGPASLCRFWAKSCQILPSMDVLHSIFLILPRAIFISSHLNSRTKLTTHSSAKDNSQWKRKHIQFSAPELQVFIRHGGGSTVKPKVKKAKPASLAT